MNKIFYPPFDLDKALGGCPVAYKVNVDGIFLATKAFIYESLFSHRMYLVESNYKPIKITDQEFEKTFLGMWVEPFKFNYWYVLDPSIKVIAMNSYGKWYGFKTKPVTYNDSFWSVDDNTYSYSLASLDPKLFPKIPIEDWGQSLIFRPGYASNRVYE